MQNNNKYIIEDKISIFIMGSVSLILAFIAQLYVYYSNKHLAVDIPIILNPLINRILKLTSYDTAFIIGISLYFISIILFIFTYYKTFNNIELSKNYLFKEKNIEKLFAKRNIILSSIFFTCAIGGIGFLYFKIHILKEDYRFYFMIIWLISLILSFLTIMFIDNKKINLKPLSLNRKEIIFLTIAIIFIALLAIPYNTYIPTLLIIDMPAKYFVGKEIANNFFNINFFSSSGHWAISYFSFIPVGIATKIFGASLSTIRLTYAVLAMLVIPVYYLFVRNIYSRNIAAISLVLLISAHVFIHYSRTAMWCIQVI
ncbi:MAG: hypothetical protein AB1782_11955, partial [Cyanobacteriota bacterium]